MKIFHAKLIACTTSFFLLACSQQRLAYDPMTCAPDTHFYAWQPLSSNKEVSSKFCTPLVPRNFQNENLSLAELIDIGLMNNPDTKETWAKAASAAANFGKSLSPYYPSLDFKGTWQRERETFFNEARLPDEPTHTIYRRTEISPELNISYILYDFGKRKNSSQRAQQALYYADWTHNQEIQIVMRIIIDDYYQFQYQRESLIAYESDLETATASLDAATTKFQNGIAAIGDVTQAKTKYLEAKMNVISQKNAVKISFAKLSTDIGMPANIDISIEHLPKEIFTEDVMDSIDQLVIKAQSQRQDFLASQAYVKENEYYLKYAKSEPLPTLNGELDIGKSWYNKNRHDDYHYTAVLKLSFPLFRGFYYTNEIKNAKANLDRSKALLQQTELSIVQDVTDAHNNSQTASETLKYSAEYLDAANQEYDIAISNYKVGTMMILNVLSAQSDLADARSRYAKAKKDWYVSIANLAYSTGSLCTPPPQTQENGCYENLCQNN